VGGRVTSRSERVALIDRRDDQPRDATRGGVNFAALPRKRGRESPLSIDQLGILSSSKRKQVF